MKGPCPIIPIVWTINSRNTKFCLYRVWSKAHQKDVPLSNGMWTRAMIPAWAEKAICKANYLGNIIMQKHYLSAECLCTFQQTKRSVCTCICMFLSSIFGIGSILMPWWRVLLQTLNITDKDKPETYQESNTAGLYIIHSYYERHKNLTLMKKMQTKTLLHC